MNQKEFIATVSADYELAIHRPDHIAYAAFCEETVNLFRELTHRHRFKVEFIDGYSTGSSDDLFKLASDHKALRVATTAGNIPDDHPLRETWYNGQTINSLARAVHDFHGHYLNRFPFETFDGELAAYRYERKLYSAIALPAVYSEAIGQLCYNYQHGTFVPFQKACILPIRDVD